jgi:hypothetical protein
MALARLPLLYHHPEHRDIIRVLDRKTHAVPSGDFHHSGRNTHVWDYPTPFTTDPLCEVHIVVTAISPLKHEAQICARTRPLEFDQCNASQRIADLCLQVSSPMGLGLIGNIQRMNPLLPPYGLFEIAHFCIETAGAMVEYAEPCDLYSRDFAFLTAMAIAMAIAAMAIAAMAIAAMAIAAMAAAPVQNRDRPGMRVFTQDPAWAESVLLHQLTVVPRSIVLHSLQDDFRLRFVVPAHACYQRVPLPATILMQLQPSLGAEGRARLGLDRRGLNIDALFGRRGLGCLAQLGHLSRTFIQLFYLLCVKRIHMLFPFLPIHVERSL